MVVDEFTELESQVLRLVEEHKGFIGEATVDQVDERTRSGTWVARIPIDHYQEFLAAVAHLGTRERLHETAQDVTEEFVDVEARIRAKRQLEAEILKLLAERTGKLSDALEVERELARVRSEIEQMQGRINYLENQTSLTTVTIRGRERYQYGAPNPAGFGDRLSLAWSESLTSFRKVCENTAIGVVWTLPFAVPLLFVGWCIRRWLKRRSSRMASTPTPTDS